ncbi:MAG: asparagine synthase (glutamine-hydrolyzing) [Spirochaetia bacterium]|nr:asparagine synthase (glutamine-hydrolyzing) [Spirochaetia bacterium]
MAFRGHSDTEVLLAGIEQWGLDRTLERSVGMFAFALWDRENRTLVLARDRIGIKPLYYGFQGDGLLFGSELKSIQAHPQFTPQMRADVMPLYLRYNYIPAPFTIWQDIFKLQPGTYLRIDARRWNGRESWSPTESETSRDWISVHSYWSAGETALKGFRNPLKVNAEEAADLLEGELRRAVKDRMVADVPLGAFLSGGVDSSTVVALMQQESDRPVKTFSIGFRERQFNEADYARDVAQHLGTNHTELTLTPEDALKVIPLLPQMYDEPYSDYSNIPTFLVSRLAREHVTVSLSGDGGDELFGGYNRHIWMNSLWRKFSRVPGFAKRAAAGAIFGVSPDGWDRLYSAASPLLPKSLALVDPGYKLHKLAGVLAAGSPLELYHGLVSEWKRPLDALISQDVVESQLVKDRMWEQMDDITAAIMYLDLVTYLPDDILTKVDRASMAVSLESRVPILDHRVVELAWKLPQHLKISGRTGKQVLRKVLYKYVPPKLIERPKQGFTVPVGLWLRGPLREWAEDLLNAESLDRQGLFDSSVVQSLWQEHLSEKRNHDSRLWPVLMFQAWHNNLKMDGMTDIF